MPTVTDIFCQFLLPALIVAAAYCITWSGKSPRARWLCPLAVSAAFAVADCFISGPPRWPPGMGDAGNWLIWFAIPLAVLGVLDGVFSPPLWLRFALLVILAALGCRTIVLPLPVHPGPAGLLGLAIIAATWWLVWEKLAERLPGPAAPLILTITYAACAVVLALANDIKPSQVAVAMTAAAAATTVIAWRRKAVSLARGAMLAWIIPLLGFLLLIHFYYYTEPPISSVVMLLVAPLLALAADIAIRRRAKTRWGWAARLAALLVALSVAVGLAARQFLAAQASDDTTATQQENE